MKGDVFKKLDLGPLPVDTIARCLGVKLAPGDVVFYPEAQRHAFGKDLERILCLPQLMDVIATPTHVGQQPDHKKGGGFELVREVPGGGPVVLVALRLKPLKKRGVYAVRSCYAINRSTLMRRVRKGTTIAV
jgi:hypothetical protein